MSIVVGWWTVPAATTVAALLWAGWSAHKDRGWLLAEVERLTRERDEARAEVERQARHIEELREKIDAERSCACSFDAPGDVCAAHSPALTRALAENARLRAQVGEYFAEPETHPVEEGR